MKSKFLSLILFSCICLTLSAQSTKKVSDKGNYLSIEIPSHWIYDADKNMVISVLICSDTILNGDRLNVYCSKAFGSLKDSYKTNQKALKDSHLKNFLIKEEGTSTLDNAETKWYIFTYSDDKETIKMAGKMVLTKKSGRLVTLKYILPEDKFEVAKGGLETIINTLHIN